MFIETAIKEQINLGFCKKTAWHVKRKLTRPRQLCGVVVESVRSLVIRFRCSSTSEHAARRQG